MTDQESFKNQIDKIIRKSHKALETARNNFDMSDYDTASSKAYYSVFHIMQAALLLKDLTYSKHSGVISGFSKEFIKTGIFPEEFSKKIRSLFKEREISDYSYSLNIEKEESGKDIENACEIVTTVEEYLKKNI